MLDHGAGLIVYLSFIFSLCYILHLNIADFMCFLSDGPLH